MRLDLSLVEVFCCVYEEGNISKAAVKLRVSQPTVSGHIKNLETYIGTKLFDRLPRRLAPTRVDSGANLNAPSSLSERLGRPRVSEPHARFSRNQTFLSLCSPYSGRLMRISKYIHSCLLVEKGTDKILFDPASSLSWND